MTYTVPALAPWDVLAARLLGSAALSPALLAANLPTTADGQPAARLPVVPAGTVLRVPSPPVPVPPAAALPPWKRPVP